MAKSTIAELAQRKADLLDELSEVNAEIASRAGEVDPTDVAGDEPATVHTATDKTVQTAENTTATP
ncbi:hypothetical protein [Mycobacterium kubicae]|uniref:hypothetical protein n=1 Tax=Mycobacterium kubicae TaxID=120959 RepID=UPI0007FF9E3F|nr:hypothetical protein [Mycobacterium kubicae]OBK42074.1 hypothetical protein A5657_08015 [Mycobacterium kubicae]